MNQFKFNLDQLVFARSFGTWGVIIEQSIDMTGNKYKVRCDRGGTIPPVEQQFKEEELVDI